MERVEEQNMGLNTPMDLPPKSSFKVVRDSIIPHKPDVIASRVMEKRTNGCQLNINSFSEEEQIEVLRG